MPRSEQYVVPPVDFILVSSGVPASNSNLSENTRGLLVGAAGTLNVTMRNGEERNGVPFFAGTNPGFFAIVRSGGTAENIWEIT